MRTGASELSGSVWVAVTKNNEAVVDLGDAFREALDVMINAQRNITIAFQVLTKAGVDPALAEEFIAVKTSLLRAGGPLWDLAAGAALHGKMHYERDDQSARTVQRARHAARDYGTALESRIDGSPESAELLDLVKRESDAGRRVYEAARRHALRDK